MQVGLGVGFQKCISVVRLCCVRAESEASESGRALRSDISIVHTVHIVARSSQLKLGLGVSDSFPASDLTSVRSVAETARHL